MPLCITTYALESKMLERKVRFQRKKKVTLWLNSMRNLNGFTELGFIERFCKTVCCIKTRKTQIWCMYDSYRMLKFTPHFNHIQCEVSLEAASYIEQKCFVTCYCIESGYSCNIFKFHLCSFIVFQQAIWSCFLTDWNHGQDNTVKKIFFFFKPLIMLT